MGSFCVKCPPTTPPAPSVRTHEHTHVSKHDDIDTHTKKKKKDAGIINGHIDLHT